MKNGIYARLERDEKQILLKLAEQQRRDPRDQAGYLIRQSLIKEGLLQPIQLIERTEAVTDDCRR